MGDSYLVNPVLDNPTWKSLSMKACGISMVDNEEKSRYATGRNNKQMIVLKYSQMGV